MLRYRSRPIRLTPVPFDRHYRAAVAFPCQNAGQDFRISAFDVGGKIDLGPSYAGDSFKRKGAAWQGQ